MSKAKSVKAAISASVKSAGEKINRAAGLGKPRKAKKEFNPVAKPSAPLPSMDIPMPPAGFPRPSYLNRLLNDATAPFSQHLLAPEEPINFEAEILIGNLPQDLRGLAMMVEQSKRNLAAECRIAKQDEASDQLPTVILTQNRLRHSMRHLEHELLEGMFALSVYRCWPEYVDRELALRQDWQVVMYHRNPTSGKKMMDRLNQIRMQIAEDALGESLIQGFERSIFGGTDGLGIFESEFRDRLANASRGGTGGLNAHPGSMTEEIKRNLERHKMPPITDNGAGGRTNVTFAGGTGTGGKNRDTATASNPGSVFARGRQPQP